MYDVPTRGVGPASRTSCAPHQAPALTRVSLPPVQAQRGSSALK
jgi:hypothetical protein